MTEQKAVLLRISKTTLDMLERQADAMGTTTTALIRTLCVEFVEGRQILHREQPQPEDKNLAAFNAEQEAQRREFYKRPGTATPARDLDDIAHDYDAMRNERGEVLQ